MLIFLEIFLEDFGRIESRTRRFWGSSARQFDEPGPSSPRRFLCGAGGIQSRIATTSAGGYEKGYLHLQQRGQSPIFICLLQEQILSFSSHRRGDSSRNSLARLTIGA
jgi:hypothetical protein